MGANQSPDSTYASVVKSIKSSFNNKKVINYQPARTSELISVATVHGEPVNAVALPSIEDKAKSYPDQRHHESKRADANNKKSLTKVVPGNKGSPKAKTSNATTGHKKLKKQRISSAESVMDADYQAQHSLHREDSDEDFVLPNKRHRSQKSPQKPVVRDVDTNNAFSPLDIAGVREDQMINQSNCRKPNASLNGSDKMVKGSTQGKDLPTKKDDIQSGARVKLHKNFGSKPSSSSKDEDKILKKK